MNSVARCTRPSSKFINLAAAARPQGKISDRFFPEKTGIVHTFALVYEMMGFNPEPIFGRLNLHFRVRMILIETREFMGWALFDVRHVQRFEEH